MSLDVSLPLDEGVIKFNCEWVQTPWSSEDLLKLEPLMTWRDRLHQLQLIGCDPHGIGYGNISCRLKQFPLENASQFLITGTQTGHLTKLPPQGYTAVIAYDLAYNWLRCQGPAKASSESLTHAALYALHPAIQGVVHIHHQALWQWSCFQIPTTNPEVPYGTPEMAIEIARLFSKAETPHGILAMAGHPDGLISFGTSIAQAAQIMLDHLGRLEATD